MIYSNQKPGKEIVQKDRRLGDIWRVAELLGMHPNTIRRKIKEGIIARPIFDHGLRNRYWDLDNLLLELNKGE